MEVFFLFVIAAVVAASWKRWVTSTPETDLPPIRPPATPDPPESGPSIWDQP